MRGGTLDGAGLVARISFGGAWVLLATGLTGAFAAATLATLVGLEDHGWGVGGLEVFCAPFVGFSLRRFFLSGVSSLSLPAFTPVSSFSRLNLDLDRPSHLLASFLSGGRAGIVPPIGHYLLARHHTRTDRRLPR